MAIQDILAKPQWLSLTKRPGFAEIPAAAIEVTDAFFTFVMQHGLHDPTSDDIRNWLSDLPEAERVLALDGLEEVFAVCQPNFLRRISEARLQAPNKPQAGCAPPTAQFEEGQGRRPAYEAKDWDPIAPGKLGYFRKRAVSIYPPELPIEYQSSVRRAADGLPGQEAGMRAPARSIVLRMRDKLCQYGWSCRQQGLDATLSIAGVDGYVADVIKRGSQLADGLRWATVRATADALLVFARYFGEDPEIMAVLRTYYREFEMRANAQKALKFFAMARNGNSTDKILDQAENLLVGVDAELRPRKRHQMRTGAAILAIFANAPLRNASAQLVFGASLFWEQGEWIIRTTIQKTHTARPEIFEFPLHPDCGRFVDAMILGDSSPSMLPILREKVLSEKRQVFVLHDGTPAAATYVPRIFKALTGDSFTCLRVMLYTDAVEHHGIDGIGLAMPSANHSSVAIVKQHYLCELVAGIHAKNLRAKREDRKKGARSAFQESFGSEG